MGPTWGPPGSCRPQMGPMLAPMNLALKGTTWNYGGYRGGIYVVLGIYVLDWKCDSIDFLPFPFHFRGSWWDGNWRQLHSRTINVHESEESEDLYMLFSILGHYSKNSIYSKFNIPKCKTISHTLCFDKNILLIETAIGIAKMVTWGVEYRFLQNCY